MKIKTITILFTIILEFFFTEINFFKENSNKLLLTTMSITIPLLLYFLYSKIQQKNKKTELKEKFDAYKIISPEAINAFVNILKTKYELKIKNSHESIFNFFYKEKPKTNIPNINSDIALILSSIKKKENSEKLKLKKKIDKYQIKNFESFKQKINEISNYFKKNPYLEETLLEIFNFIKNKTKILKNSNKAKLSSILYLINKYNLEINKNFEIISYYLDKYLESKKNLDLDLKSKKNFHEDICFYNKSIKKLNNLIINIISKKIFDYKNILYENKISEQIKSNFSENEFKIINENLLNNIVSQKIKN